MNASHQLALKALELANVHSGQTAQDVVDRAKIFLIFMEGRNEEDALREIPAQNPQPLPAPANEPGTKRVRRTKEQIAADTIAAAQGANLLSAPQAAVQQIAQEAAKKAEPTYMDLQKLMVKVVEAKGFPAGAAVLAQFGIDAGKGGTAKMLQPKQWAECIELLEAELVTGKGLA